MKIQHLSLLLAVSFSTTACAPAIVGGFATAGYLGAQERGAKAAVLDTKVKTHIKDKLTQIDYHYLTQAEVVVLQGNVLLTGVVKDEQARAEIERVVRSVPGVKSVYNELYSDGFYATSQYTKDSWLSTQVKGRLFAAKDVYSINYFVRVVNSTVYIMGLAETQSEMERVLHLARITKGVKSVVNYIHLYQDDHNVIDNIKELDPRD